MNAPTKALRAMEAELARPLTQTCPTCDGRGEVYDDADGEWDRSTGASLGAWVQCETCDGGAAAMSDTPLYVPTDEEIAAQQKRLDDSLRSVSEGIDRMKRERDALLEALEFYANPNVYRPHPHGPAFDNRDLSFVAKAALAIARGEG